MDVDDEKSLNKSPPEEKMDVDTFPEKSISSKEIESFTPPGTPPPLPATAPPPQKKTAPGEMQLLGGFDHNKPEDRFSMISFMPNHLADFEYTHPPPLKGLEYLTRDFLKTKGLVNVPILSYNHFISHQMKEIAQAHGFVQSKEVPGWFLRYDDIRLVKPSERLQSGAAALDPKFARTPNECRQLNLSYTAEIRVDITYQLGDTAKAKKHVCLGELPIMLKSDICELKGKSAEELAKLGECATDPGGYFIINGREKSMPLLEQACQNRILVDTDVKNQEEFVCSVTSSTVRRKSLLRMFHKGGLYFVEHSNFTAPIPVVVLMRAFGVSNTAEILNCVGMEKLFHMALFPSLRHATENNIFSSDDAVNWLKSRVKAERRDDGGTDQDDEERVRRVLFEVVLNHVPVRDMRSWDMRRRGEYLGVMWRKLILTQKGYLRVNDRDYYGNKRVITPGAMIAYLFEDQFLTFNEQLRRYVAHFSRAKGKAAPFDISRAFNSQLFTTNVLSSFARGQWFIPRFRMNRHSVTLNLNRLSYAATLGQLTRVNSQFEKSRKVSGPRAVHTSQYGVICVTDTPEGESCGLDKHLCLTAIVSLDTEDRSLEFLLMELGTRPLADVGWEAVWRQDYFQVFVNGRLIGTHSNAEYLVQQVRAARRQGIISEFVSINRDVEQRAVMVASDGGRLMRPLIIVENGKPLLTQEHLNQVKSGIRNWSDCIMAGTMEYLDVNEAADCMVATYTSNVTTQTTHLEMDNTGILGAVPSLIPFPDHNQSPRNTYQCAMGRQAMGFLASNQNVRFDNIQYQLWYPQVPLAQSRNYSLMGFDELPAGQNAIVAVMSYSCYDIEDAIIVNRASLDRGFGRCFVYRSETIQFKAGDNETLRGPMLENLANGERRYAKHHHTYSIDGTAIVGEKIENGDILVHKGRVDGASAPSSSGGGGGPSGGEESATYHEYTYFRSIRPGYVDAVAIGQNERGAVVNIRSRQTRIPEVGDKFSSRHGQKGVVGYVVAPEDMPFTEDGITPDIIMNPHGFPSRMTVGKLKELLGSKAGAISGSFCDATPFYGDSTEQICEILRAHGFEEDGKQMLISGLCGAPVQGYIYVGPIYYQRLKHMVMDKVHARARGQVTTLTRQATEGRSRQGGLRVGEMERDCLISYGAANLLRERLLLSADMFETCICQACERLCMHDWCAACQRSDSIALVKMPYAFKLLCQELMAMNISTKLHLKDIDERQFHQH